MSMEMALVKAEPQEQMTIEPLSSLPAEEPMPLAKLRPFQRRGPKVAIQDLVVQCSACFKWRIVPSEEIYESIRESGKPWFCENADVWNRDVSCSDPTDVELKESCEETIWALDKPCLPKTPHGWKRELVIRGQGSTRFGDIYYISPCGKKLRSMVEVSKFLEEHPEYAYDGVDITQFCFATPQPVDKSYVRKRNRGDPQSKVFTIKKSKALLGPSQSSEFPPVPQGWTRRLKVRCLSTSPKLCSVSYISPCGKRIRTVCEMDQFLRDNPHYELSVEQFSFITPTSDRGIVRAASEPGCELIMADSVPRLTNT